MSNGFGFHERITPIVITGGPCAGKSSAMAMLKQRLENNGLHVITLREVATEILGAGFSYDPSRWQKNCDFQKHLLKYILERENRYYAMIKDLSTDRHSVILCDRGALDAIAYMGREAFREMAGNLGYSIPGLLERYKAVIHMVTAADGAEHAYTLENNENRNESPTLARELDKKTLSAWQGHQHHTVIDNSTDFEGKKFRVLQSLSRILQMPEPKEIEKKYWLRNFYPSMIPRGHVGIDIVQDYLLIPHKGEGHRVRMRTLDGVSSYYYTQKKDTDDPRVRVEVEHQILRDEYLELLESRDPMRNTIEKTRYPFLFEGRMIELDVYHGGALGLFVAEVELADPNEIPLLPKEWDVVEVTANPLFKNAEIARLLKEGTLRETLLSPQA